MTPEFSRPERIDTIGERERTVEVAADEGERRALAARFGLLSIERLEARFAIRRQGAAIAAAGRVTAAVTQACIATGEPLPAEVNEPVELLFVQPGTATDEIELSADALDTVEIEGGAVDLGEAAAETVALALDPFPRAPNADGALRAAGVLREDELTPFNGLSVLRDKLAGR